MDKITQLDHVSLLHNLVPRKKNAHKHDFGHVLVIGGDYGYAGAPVLSALGALRTGAGLVTIASHAEHLLGLNCTHPEIMSIAIDSPEILSNLIPHVTVMVLGPGLGRSKWSQQVFDVAMHYELPTIVDADGLYFASKHKHHPKNWIITPHPGEASTMLEYKIGSSTEERLTACNKLIQQYNATVVLKGAGTLVGSISNEVAICEYGNPGMASAGMGDLLTGVIAGLLAQGLSLDNAARLGVCIHAIAGDRAAAHGQRGLIATDLLHFMRELLQT